MDGAGAARIVVSGIDFSAAGRPSADATSSGGSSNGRTARPSGTALRRRYPSGTCLRGSRNGSAAVRPLAREPSGPSMTSSVPGPASSIGSHT